MPLATCRRNAPTPSACLTRLESKNKKNYDAGEACEGEKRFHFSPTSVLAGLPGQSPALFQRPPRAPGGKAQRHRSLQPRWPLLLSSAGACLRREGGWPLQTTKREARPGGHAGRASPGRRAPRGDRLNNLERKPALSPHFEFSRTRQTIRRATQRPAAQPPLQVFRILQRRATHC